MDDDNSRTFKFKDTSTGVDNIVDPLIFGSKFSNLNDTEYSWSFGDGNTANGIGGVARNPEHTYAQSGSYNVALTLKNNYGTQTNTDCKISILNLREPGDIDGEEQYSTFSLQVRKFGDTDKSPSILEQYDRLNLNPDSPNYIARAIGDRYAEWNEDRQKVIIYGDYPNKSRYIRVEVDAAVDNGSYSPKLSPRGYDVILDPIYSGSTSSPEAVLDGEANT